MNDVLRLAKAVRKINTIFSTFKDSIYTKNEADDKFINQELMENGLYVIKNKNVENMNDAIQPGVYSIPATGVRNNLYLTLVLYSSIKTQEESDSSFRRREQFLSDNSGEFHRPGRIGKN